MREILPARILAACSQASSSGGVESRFLFLTREIMQGIIDGTQPIVKAVILPHGK